MPEFTRLDVSVEEQVALIALDRPNKANALDGTAWLEIGRAFEWADQTPEVRAVVLSGAGKNFCAGIDYALIGEIAAGASAEPEGNKQAYLRSRIMALQACFTQLERCRKPVIAAVHGSCFGGGVDLICACDIRYSTSDARFCVKEVDLAIVADVGTLQRLPHIVGQGMTRELALTAKEIDGEAAKAIGLVNTTLPDREALLAHAKSTARQIASKSPMAVRGTKQVLNWCRDHSIADGLDYVATWNAGMLLSEDAQEAFGAMMAKRAPTFKD